MWVSSVWSSRRCRVTREWTCRRSWIRTGKVAEFKAKMDASGLDVGSIITAVNPMAVNPDAARSTGKTLMISYNQRFGSDVRFPEAVY